MKVNETTGAKKESRWTKEYPWWEEKVLNFPLENANTYLIFIAIDQKRERSESLNSVEELFRAYELDQE